MKFKANTRRRALEYEKDWVQKWKADKTFEKSVENRQKDNAYVFYDGPPFISGSPHHGTLLSSIVKDAIPRYQTMKGKRVERVWGWDCHGLPAERFTEKKLGINSREEVLEYGLEKYIVACRDNMVQTSSEWEDVVDRIGRWVDFKGAYKTMDKEYMESVWWAFKELHKKGKIYEGEKVLMYCTLDATPLSKAEVTMDAGAYQDVTDPSVYVKFRLKSEPHAMGDEKGDETKPLYMLAWTTTPWTLPANTALAINPDAQYNEYILDGERVIIAATQAVNFSVNHSRDGLEYGKNPKLVRSFMARELIGLKYEPLFGMDRGENAHKVWGAPYVDADVEGHGTGIVHLAPAYGEEDFELAKKMKIPVVHTIDENGMFTESDWKGENVWAINKQIAKDLKERGIVWKIDYIRHSYPHCHRCGTKLMYRAHPSWFFDVQGQKELMLAKNSEQINWFPKHLKHGRWEKNIEQAPDWNLSRDRFWATAMPVWEGQNAAGEKHQIIVGSYAELKELSGVELDDYHRPWVDDIEFDKDGIHYKRIDKVIDGWFESGSMSFAQFHYPFENKEKFEANFPGDFIVEYIGQVRAWFYYMHVVSIGLFGESSFKNVITTGTLAGNDGRKMSKSYGNFTDPNELMDKFSADSLRFLLLSSPLLSGEDFSLQDKDVGDVARKLSMVWNMYDFFTMYAEVDGWEFDGELKDPLDDCNNPLDIWIISRIHQLVADVEKHMNGYNLPDAMSPILPFLDDASNWYVRRSRRRFWKSEDDNDKDMAYRTLHYVLVRLAYVLAPFTPFLAEELYHNLTGDKQSIHLKDWLPAGQINELTVKSMELTRRIVNEGLSARATAGIKVRQPLAQAVAVGTPDFFDSLPHDQYEYYQAITAEELNVKTMAYNYEYMNKTPLDFAVKLETEITPELRREGLMREVIRYVQSARKKAGLNVDDRIELALMVLPDVSEELEKAIEEHSQTIQSETLTSKFGDVHDGHDETVTIEGMSLRMVLKKAA